MFSIYPQKLLLELLWWLWLIMIWSCIKWISELFFLEMGCVWGYVYGPTYWLPDNGGWEFWFVCLRKLFMILIKTWGNVISILIRLSPIIVSIWSLLISACIWGSIGIVYFNMVLYVDNMLLNSIDTNILIETK